GPAEAPATALPSGPTAWGVPTVPTNLPLRPVRTRAVADASEEADVAGGKCIGNRSPRRGAAIRGQPGIRWRSEVFRRNSGPNLRYLGWVQGFRLEALQETSEFRRRPGSRRRRFLADQRGVERDVDGGERLGHRAARLGGLGRLLDGVGFDAGVVGLSD